MQHTSVSFIIREPVLYMEQYNVFTYESSYYLRP